ncbi:diphthine methyltransferase homolog isoform X2 [Toxorhynchites rutilus septentrionalis]|nr:diphthine methyltransferase homolog isoform X2 [Toxorhynchites rutilus septentrionalis]
MPAITTLHTYDTVYCADSVAWCPHDYYEHLFACGTYQLSEGESLTSTSGQSTRKGRILLFDFDLDQNLLICKQKIETSAVLDQKWHSSIPSMAVANSNGEISMYKFSTENLLTPEDTLKISSEEEGEILALSLDWTSQGDKLAVSDSKGGISIISVEESSLRQVHRWVAHTFEAWICAFDKNNQNILYTGGDDSLLCVYDMRCLQFTIAKMKNKSHRAGVTSILSFSQQENLLATGSYDDNLRIFDIRSMKSSVSETNLQGGVWRLKSHPIQPSQILCACMYHNFSVVTLNEDHSISVDAEYNEHGSICYGCDWSYKKSERSAKYFASCSFYDHKMCLAVLKGEK